PSPAPGLGHPMKGARRRATRGVLQVPRSDHSFVSHRRDLGVAITRLAQDLVGVLARFRGFAHDPELELAELQRERELRDPVFLDVHLPRPQLLVLERRVDPEDRADAAVCAGETRGPVLLGARAEDRGKPRLDRLGLRAVYEMLVLQLRGAE